MKKFFVSLVAALLAVPTFAQTNSGGFKLSESTVYYGLRLGIDFATISGDNTDDLTSRTGINLGGVVGLRISDRTPLYLESGLYYTERGAKYDKGGTTVKSALAYLEIPVLIKYGIQATEEISILPYVGPYFSMGIGGKTKVSSPLGSSSEGSFSSDAWGGGFSRPDMGFKIGCGAEYNMVYAEVGYQIGVANIAKNDNDTRHGNALYISLGVNF
jgi:hypothetical protein